jgi:hypothetical protein
VLAAQPAYRQPGDALDVESFDLLSDMAHGLQAAQSGGPRDQVEQRIGPDPPDWSLWLRPKHTHVTLALGIVGYQQQGDGPAAPPPLHAARMWRSSTSMTRAYSIPFISRVAAIPFVAPAFFEPWSAVRPSKSSIAFTERNDG